MSAAKCPICGKAASIETRPFCSNRCRAVDLQRWFSGGYAIPSAGDEADPSDEVAND